MTEHVWWYLARSSGVVAFALVTASVAFGLALSTRLFGRSVAPKWLIEIHRFLGALVVAMTALHVVALLADSYVEFSIADVVVPWVARWNTNAVALGVLAMWLVVAIQGTSLLMQRIPRRLWRAVHTTSFVLFALALAHGLMAGTDGGSRTVQTAGIAATTTVLFLALVRLLTPRAVARRASARAGP